MFKNHEKRLFWPGVREKRLHGGFNGIAIAALGIGFCPSIDVTDQNEEVERCCVQIPQTQKAAEP
jgi:hypothetical protein